MATNFLEAPGTSGFITAPFNLMSSELNALATGNTATSSVGGTSGVFSQTNIANAIWGKIWFSAGGAFTPTGVPDIHGWFLSSDDGGTHFEAAITANADLPRPPDFVIPFWAAAYASGNRSWAPGLVKLPFESFKVYVRSNLGVSLSASGHTIQLGSVAVQF